MTIFSEDYVDKLDDEARRLMNIILSNAKKMGHLIDDLLEFSKLGRRELTRVNVSMKDMVENLWDELKRTEGQREFEFRLDDLPAVKADGISIRHVWTNLISNAIKYTRGNQKASIEIGAREIENEIIYFVKDNGAGFDMRYYDKLFGVFQRLHKPSEFEGTGVGLAIVQRIITKHGGRVWAEAKVNEGATFYFSLSRDKG
jgi:light-regulated signal transduction histidine kinase (bacteriophytochrome)